MKERTQRPVELLCLVWLGRRCVADDAYVRTYALPNGPQRTTGFDVSQSTTKGLELRACVDRFNRPKAHYWTQCIPVNPSLIEIRSIDRFNGSSSAQPTSASQHAAAVGGGSSSISSSGSGGGGGKRAAAATPPVPIEEQQQQPLNLLAGLPEAVQGHMLAFLPRWDVGSLLQVSQDAGRVVAPAIRELHLAVGERWNWIHDPSAPVRLLRRAPNLRRLAVTQEPKEVYFMDWNACGPDEWYKESDYYNNVAEPLFRPVAHPPSLPPAHPDSFQDQRDAPVGSIN